MNRKGNVFFKDYLAGVIEETETGYRFSYDEEYLSNEEKWPVSKTLPLSEHSYSSNTMFPFFDGLIPEGWLLDVAVDNCKLKANDRMGLFKFEKISVLCRFKESHVHPRNATKTHHHHQLAEKRRCLF